MSSTELVVYDRVENPLEFAERIGKAIAFSGMFGCKNEQQGVVLALACLAEKKNPIEIAKTYHIIDGKLSMRADAMLAEFRLRGGKHKWLETGDDGQAAEGEFVFDGQTMKVAFSLADARRMELVRKGSQWVKDPGAMLRARVISKAIRMIAPEIIAGCYAPEEITLADGRAAVDAIDAEISPENGQPINADAKETIKRRARKALAAGKEAVGTEAPSAAASPAAGETEIAAERHDDASAPPAAALVSAETLKRIESYGPQAFGDKWADMKAKTLAARKIGALRSLSQEAGEEILEKLMAKVLGLEEATRRMEQERKNSEAADSLENIPY